MTSLGSTMPFRMQSTAAVVDSNSVIPDKGELLVAFDSRRLAVNVSAMEDKAKDREKAIELAQRIIDRL
jgi:hypothetical protein